MPGWIEDYALIGDLETAALVGRDGSVDWMCVPRFDSPACFAALLGHEDNGRWQLAPAGGARCSRRSYRGDTLVLDTVWESVSGTVRVTDFMPPRRDAPHVVRIVECLGGRVPMHTALCPRFHHGRVVPWMRTGNGAAVSAIGGPDSAHLHADVPMDVSPPDGCATADFTVSAGDRVAFAMSWCPSHTPAPPEPEPQAMLATTLGFWEDWASRCTYRGPWREAVVRSLITQKALTYAPTGGMVSAPTTSLPQDVGGERNWDYRYCWLSDSAAGLSSLLRTGFRDEAVARTDWLVRAIAGDPADLQSVYGVAGQRRLGEISAHWLPGYEASSPVRIGNAAVGQLPLHAYGEVMHSLYAALRAHIPVEHHVWSLVASLMSHLEQRWQEPDEGLWEVRGPRRHFVHSKIMAWVAADRALRLAGTAGLRPLAGRWRALRKAVRAEVSREGWDPARGTFVQFYGSDRIDATALLIPRLGFLTSADPRVRSTVDEVSALEDHGLLRRYTGADGGPVHEVDGLPGGEGVFLPCSLWYADALAATGRTGRAREVFENVLAVRNDVGLLSEGWCPALHRQLGNTPRAFSHIALIDTAYALDDAAHGPRAAHVSRAA